MLVEETLFRLERIVKHPPFPIDLYAISESITGKSVLITGAGGSIGSKLSRKLAELKPKSLILLDGSEAALYQMVVGLQSDGCGVPIVPVLGDAGDVHLLEGVFDSHDPEIIFHTAAYKHVPLLERQPLAALKNNVLGTYNLVCAAARGGNPRMIMLSTDKAVNPVSIMGASKRIAELTLLALNSRDCRLTSVRLGNVLGSQGSVVPRFAEQIQRGVPVTVTHPDAARFFVTNDEAVQLVLGAASIGTGGDILVPDLGSPVKIVDLAREMIKSARPPSLSDPPIVFTGLRPGEKLIEELLGDGERTFSFGQHNIARVTVPVLSVGDTRRFISEIEDGLAAGDGESIITKICEIVPEYRPSEAIMDAISASSSTGLQV